MMLVDDILIRELKTKKFKDENENSEVKLLYIQYLNDMEEGQSEILCLMEMVRIK